MGKAGSIGYLSFIIIVPICLKDKNKHYFFSYLVNKPMLLVYSTRPLSGSISFQEFWMPRSCLGMFYKLIQQLQSLFERLWLTLFQP